MTREDGLSGAGGFLRRLIDLRRTDAHTVAGWLEDDFHRFGISIVHNGERIREVHAWAERYPWSTCPGAVAPLQALVGQPLTSRASDIGLLLEMRLHCTHLFDLAGLVSAHAARREEHRRYEAIVEDRAVTAADPILATPLALGPGTAVLLQNGSEVLRWSLEDQCISAPAASAGRSLQRGFREWTEAMPEDDAEHATVLRRAIMVAAGRMMNLDRFDTASQLGRTPVCYSFQLERSRQARRVPHSRRDYAQGSERPLADLG